MNGRPVLFCALLLSACTAPTLQQRQDNWRKVKSGTQAACVVGQADPAMPPEVREWCTEVTK